MLVIHACYILLENYRISTSGQWLSKTLNFKDAEKINDIGRWLLIVEVLLIILVLFAALISLKISHRTFFQFILTNVLLFIVITLISYIVSLSTILPIGNLLQPLVLPIIILIGFSIYMLWKVNHNKISSKYIK